MYKNDDELTHHMMGTTTLITGGAGFIGSHMADEIIGRGGSVIVVDDLSQGKKENIVQHINNKRFHFVQGDCNKKGSIAPLFRKYTIDYVIHYAATVGVTRTVNNPLDVLDDVQGISHILELAHISQVKKVVYASSSEVYGEPVELPEKEDGVLNPHLPYAVVKLVGEKFMRAYWETHHLPTTSLRFFNVYGPRQESSDYGAVMGIFMRQILQNNPPTIFGDGLMTRNFVYVRDNVMATLDALVREETHGEVINIGSGEPITILELAHHIIQLAHKDISPRFLPKRVQGEITHRYPDLNKMHQLLKCKPSVSLEEGLKLTYDWYGKHLST